MASLFRQHNAIGMRPLAIVIVCEYQLEPMRLTLSRNRAGECWVVTYGEFLPAGLASDGAHCFETVRQPDGRLAFLDR